MVDTKKIGILVGIILLVTLGIFFSDRLSLLSFTSVFGDGHYLLGESNDAVTGLNCEDTNFGFSSSISGDLILKTCTAKYWTTRGYDINSQSSDTNIIVDAQLDSGKGLYIRSTKDLKNSNFRTDIDTMEDCVPFLGGERCTPLPVDVKITDGTTVVDIATIEGVGLLEISPSKIDNNQLGIFWKGQTIGTADITGLDNSFVEFSAHKRFIIQNPRYQLLFDCRLKPNEVFVFEPVEGHKVIGVSQDPLTFGLSKPVKKFCLSTPMLWISASQSGVTTDAQPYYDVINGKDFICPTGDLCGFYYVVDSAEVGGVTCTGGQAFSLETNNCIGFVQTCAGEIDTQTGECTTKAEFVDDNEHKTLTEFIESTVQCQTDEDCAFGFPECDQKTYTCDIISNKCQAIGTCEDEITYATLGDVIDSEAPDTNADIDVDADGVAKSVNTGKFDYMRFLVILAIVALVVVGGYFGFKKLT